MDVQNNWYEDFFRGIAVDLWRQALPPEHSKKEADDIAALLAAPAGAEILDVPCGHGRLSLEFAARGYRVTGVDLSTEALGHAGAADPDGLVAWEHRDMRDLPWPGRFDGAFCFGNSFGYLDDEGNLAFLRAVAAALKPRARFVLETPMVLESLLTHLKDRPWFKAGDMQLLVENAYDPARGRLDIEYTFVSNGRTEQRRSTHRAYTYRQLIELMDAAGFSVGPDHGWTRAAPMIRLVAHPRMA
ncbi:MAG TPA: class I SAM-dependent methyltransferase [Vicinamibacterales bacterium]|nr:class I SAM-dependent methyltransferase [Vicinamibacterales bacterium]